MDAAKFIPAGFYAAGAMNILGAIGFSAGFTNTTLFAVAPEMFAPFGLLMVMVWGAAYIAVAKNFQSVPALVFVFGIEKLCYVVSWIVWLSQHGEELPAIAERSMLAAGFFALYGAGDLVCAMFFFAVWGYVMRQRSALVVPPAA